MENVKIVLSSLLPLPYLKKKIKSHAIRLSLDEQGQKIRCCTRISMKMFLPDTRHHTRQELQSRTKKRRSLPAVSFNRTGSSLCFFLITSLSPSCTWGFNALLLLLCCVMRCAARCWGGANNNGMKAGNNDSAHRRVTKERGKGKEKERPS